MGPQIHELAIFFIKRTPFEFGFCVGKCSKILKLDNSGPIGRPPIFQNGPQNVTLNTWVGNFFIKQTPFEFGFCVRKSWKIFKSVHCGPIGRPLNMSQMAPNTPNTYERLLVINITGGAWNLPHKFHLYLIFIPLRAKRVGEFFENGHNKISPAAFHLFGPKYFLRPFGQKCMSQKKILGRGSVGPGPGAKKQWFVKLSQLFDKI